jgi:A/G-specific adenine glycosylase
LPWRASNDFYRVYLSEIMLQQTRVETAIPYYLKFLERFPSAAHLAAASQNDVLALWSGLGYYSRARNLHLAASRIAGAPPGSYEEVLALPGVGPYTAAAIASIALGLPHAAVDGNVIRVISRLTNDASESSSPVARRRFGAEAALLLDPRRPGDFNQAMMELGATVCVPRNPRCRECPVRRSCAAQAAGTQNQLPVKLKKQPAREVPLDLVLLKDAAQRVFLVQRSSSEARLAGFMELPDKRLFPRLRAEKRGEFRHQIVGDRFCVTVWTARTPAKLPPGEWRDMARLHEIPLTTISRKALAAHF